LIRQIPFFEWPVPLNSYFFRRSIAREELAIASIRDRRKIPIAKTQALE